ncbi:MAG: hypothetical protein WBF77_00110 [Sulfurimonadaceae bacterium]
MLELIIVIVLLYVSYKLYLQDALMQEQNELIESLQERQEDCKQHITKLEKLYDTLSKVSRDDAK